MDSIQTVEHLAAVHWRERRRRIYLAAAAFLLVASAAIFVTLGAEILHNDWLTRNDRNVAAWFHAHMTPRATAAMKAVTELAAFWTVTTLASILGLILVLLKKWQQLLLLIVALPGGRLLCYGLKVAFQRQRPQFNDLNLTVTGYSFPSYHAMDATLLYGFVVIFALVSLQSWRARLALTATASLLILLIGLSRVALDAHYVSDVVGAIAAGLAWLSICFAIFQTCRRSCQEIRPTAFSTRPTKSRRRTTRGAAAADNSADLQSS